MATRFLIISDRYGTGDEELGRLLIRNFLYSLARDEATTEAVMFANAGVRLCCTESDSVEDLKLLAARGTAIKACGTCLDYLGLTEQLAVGEIGTMPAAVSAMLSDDKIVTIG